jgi:hypothetical protein
MKSLWDEAARLASPVGPEYLANDPTAPKVIRQLSAVAVQDNKDLAAGLMSWVMPEAQNWWRWQPAKAVGNRPGVARWLHECTEIAHDELRASNFYTEVFALMLQRNTSGTPSIWMRTKEESDVINGTWPDESPLHFECVQAQDIMIVEDARGRVHKWFRTVMLTAEQAVQEFGSKAPPGVQEEARNPTKRSNRSEYLHCIYRRYKPEGQSTQEQMPWASVWVCPRTKTILKTSGYARQPIFTTRWERWTRRSPYGISPSIIALGEIRGVNYFEMLLTTLAEVSVEPRIQVPVEHDGPVDLGPAGVTKIISPDIAPKEWATAGRIDWGIEFLERKEKRIHEIFLKDVFAQFSMLERQMTAYEISQRLTEKLSRVSPATGMLTSDFFNPMLESLFHWCYTSGRFPEAPLDAWVPDALGRPKMPFPNVVQTNRLAREQNAQTEQAMARIMGTLQPIAEVVGPAIYDALDFDRLPQALAIEVGLDPELIRTPEAIAALQQQRAQQAQQQAALEIATKQPELAAAAIGAQPTA